MGKNWQQDEIQQEIYEQQAEAEQKKQVEAEKQEEEVRQEETGMQEAKAQETAFTWGGFCEEIVSLLMTAYLFIMFCIYPFYTKNGYVEIGKEKYNFYKAITFGGFALILPLALLCLGSYWLNHKKRVWQERIFSYEGMSGTDFAVLAYGISVVLSYIGSDYKELALWGEEGWYMGLVTQLLFVVSYFLVSRFWEYEEKLLLAFMAAATVVFGLGVLNRFSIFPIKMEGANSSFLSTMGNINWYCGYWAVLFPIGFVLYWSAREWWIRFWALLCTMIGIATGVSQGSNSAFIVFAGVYVFLFCPSFKNQTRMKRFLELAILFCLTCQGLRVWRLLRPEAFDYYESSLSWRMTLSRMTLFALIPLVLIYIMLCLAGRKKEMDVARYKPLRQIAIISFVIGAGIYVLLLMINGRVEDGLRSMGEWSALRFDNQWGSARGATWSAGGWTYRNIPVLRKLIGVGPDCFAAFLYTIPDLAKSVIKQFDGARLTNAHNEWLTILVNNGIFGFISYGGIFVTAVLRYVYYAEKALGGKKRYLYIFALCAFAYTIHNVVSFQQILSTPFMFLMLGMGECLVRDRNAEEETAV